MIFTFLALFFRALSSMLEIKVQISDGKNSTFKFSLSELIYVIFRPHRFCLDAIVLT